MRICHIGPMRHIGLAALALAASGCAYNDSRIQVAGDSTAPIVQAGNTATTTKPTDLQANGNNLAYGTAGASVGAGVGMLAGNPAAGALIGAGGGVAVYQIKEALSTVPAVPAASVVPAATGTATQAVTAPSAAVTGTPSSAPAAAGAQGGDANGARGNPPGG